MNIHPAGVPLPQSAPRSRQQRHAREAATPAPAGGGRMRSVPVESLRAGDRVWCQEQVDGRSQSFVRVVSRVSRVGDMVRYDVAESAAGTHVRIRGTRVTVVA